MNTITQRLGAYIDAMTLTTKEVFATHGAIDSLLEQFKADPSLFLSSEWTNEIKSLVVKLSSIGETTRQIQSPVELSAAYAEYSIAATHLITASQFMLRWLDDPQDLNLLASWDQHCQAFAQHQDRAKDHVGSSLRELGLL